MFSFRLNKTKQSGFTLVELLIVIALVAILAGVTTDIVLTLVRSYSKTKITNEIEQTGNFVISKMEKELRSATSITTPATVGSSATTLILNREINNVTTQITYDLATGGLALTRQEGPDPAPVENLINATNNNILISNTDLFTLIQQNPDVIKIKLVLQQADLNAQKSFTGSIQLDQTVVLRQTY